MMSTSANACSSVLCQQMTKQNTLLLVNLNLSITRSTGKEHLFTSGIVTFSRLSELDDSGRAISIPSAMEPDVGSPCEK